MDEDQLAQILNSLEQNLSEIGLSALVAQERLSAVEGKAEKPTAQEIAELCGPGRWQSILEAERRAVAISLQSGANVADDVAGSSDRYQCDCPSTHPSSVDGGQGRQFVQGEVGVGFPAISGQL